MKFAKLFAAAVALMAVVTACQEPVESVNPNAGMEIAVSAQMYNFTKATDTAFEEGDQIGLHIVIPQGTYLNNAKYTYTEGALVAEQTNYWYDSEDVEAQVLAYYPYAATATYKEAGYTFTVEADQSVEGGYAASDLLVASTTSKPTAEAVALPFKHALSKVVINIESELDEAIQSVMFADVYGSAVINLAEGTSEVNGDKGTIKAAKVADKESYTLIIVPQEQVSPRIFVTIEGDKQYVFNIEAAADFAAGKVATANIALTKELVGTEFSTEITDWVGDSELQFNPSEENTPEEGGDDNGENGENGEGNEGTEPEDPEVFVPAESGLGVVGSFAASGWATDALLMTTPEEGILVAEDITFAAGDEFKVRTAGSWTDINVGASAAVTLQANKYVVAASGSNTNFTVEAEGVYDIYFNQTTLVVYLMVDGVSYTEATEQVVEGPEVTDSVLYLAPNANWNADGARFAAYFFGAGEVWLDMADEDADGVYEVNIPEGGYTTVIFCRMNPGAAANNWDNKWNQTADLTIPTDGNNLYTITDDSWDAGTWSTK